LQTRRSYAGGEYGGRASAYRYGTGATATSTSPSGPISARNNKDGVVLACVGPREGGRSDRLLAALTCPIRLRLVTLGRQWCCRVVAWWKGQGDRVEESVA